MTQGLELRGAILGKGYRLGQRRDDIEPNTYDATHERIPGHFVIRIFPPETLSVPESASRIQRGARVASLLRDPHTVQVLDCNASGETPAFVVMERQAGQLLSKVMAEDGMLALARVADLVDSLAAALSAGHLIGLVHGDLRPAHVFLPPSGQPVAKLSGFGWAKELRAATLVPAPSGYLAPEQHFGKVLTLDERVDQFGLAALAYEMIAACQPFSEESADMAELLGRPRTPPAITDLVPEVPPGLDDVLRRALSFEPAERFSSVLELAAKLREAVSIQPEAAAPDAYVPDVGSIPTKASTDITEELDLATLSAVRAHDTGDRRGDADDADLVLGSRESILDSSAGDDAKTQIRRSPFLDEDADGRRDDHDRGSHEAHLARTTHAVPVWNPSDSDSRRHAVVLGPTDGSLSVRNTARIRPLGSMLSLAWAEVRSRPKWAIPVAAGFLLLLVGGVTLLSSGRSETDGSRGINSDGSLGRLQSSPVGSAEGLDAPSSGTARSEVGSASAGAPPAPAPIRPQVELLPPPPSEKAAPILFETRPMRRSRARRSAGRYAGSSAVIADSSAGGLSGGTLDGCSIRVSSNPWAEVWIDGRNTGRKTPLDNLKVACGVHKLELKRPDKDIGSTEMLNLVPGVPYRGDYELD